VAKRDHGTSPGVLKDLFWDSYFSLVQVQSCLYLLNHCHTYVYVHLNLLANFLFQMQ
jgi:hypothetical protein